MGKFKYKYPDRLTKIAEKVIQNLKRYHKWIISLAVAIVLPWILTLIFIGFLKLTHGLSDELNEDPILLSRITIFYALNLSYELPILGFGYSLCMIVWAVVGLFIGLYTREMGKSLISAMIGIFVTFFLYFPSVYIVGVSIYRDITIHPLIFTRLYEDFTTETPIFLLYHISFHSFALPVLIMFTLLGSMLNPPRKVFLTTPSELLPEKIKSKAITYPEEVKAEKDAKS